MRIFRRLSCPGPAAGRPATPPDARRAVERLSEDEALRGDLTDEGYGPLLGVVAGLAIARAGRFASTDDLYLALRRLLKGAVDAAERSDFSTLAAAATPALIAPDERAVLLGALPRRRGSADEVAAGIAHAIAMATGLEEVP